MKSALNRQSPIYHAVSFVTRHQLIIGLLLVLFGVGGVSFALANPDGTYILYANWRTFLAYASGWTVPLLLVIALVGTLMLSVYCVKGIRPEVVDNKEHAAFLVTALGFGYLVLGAWPLWTLGYFWPWQKEIASYGNLLILPLYAGSVFAFGAGAVSLYIHSKIYHQKHPEMSNPLS